MSYPQAVNQSYKLKACSQHATRKEKVYVRTRMCTRVKTQPSRQGLHRVAEGVESLRGNLSGNGSKLQIFSSFDFFLLQSPAQLSAFSDAFFPLGSRVLLLAGTRLNYRSHLCLV